MVMVTGVIEKINSKTNNPFVLLELSGGLELVQSKETGNFYATTRKCRIPSTFNLEVATMMIGSSVEGSIVKVEVDPYEYVVPNTGEVVKLAHSYAYQPPGSMNLIGETPIEVVSNNKPALSKEKDKSSYIAVKV